MFERYSFVAITSADLERSKRFWEGVLGCHVTEDKPGAFFIVDAGGPRLCVDAEDGNTHVVGSTDPTIGLKVSSVQQSLAALNSRGLNQHPEIVHAKRGAYAILRDPEGHSIVLTEAD